MRELNLNIDITYYFSHCPNETCNETYIGKINRRIKERIMDHKRDKSSHLLKHARERQHTHAWKDDFKSSMVT